MNYAEQLSKIEKNVEDSKLEKATLEERQRKLQEEHTKILEELKKEEIAEGKLEETIEEIEVSIQEEIKKCQKILK